MRERVRETERKSQRARESESQRAREIEPENFNLWCRERESKRATRGRQRGMVEMRGIRIKAV